MIHNSPLEVNLFVLLMTILFLAYVSHFRSEFTNESSGWYINYLDLSIAGSAAISFGILMNIYAFMKDAAKGIIYAAAALILLGLFLLIVAIAFNIYGFESYNGDVALWLIVSTSALLVIFESVF